MAAEGGKHDGELLDNCGHGVGAQGERTRRVGLYSGEDGLQTNRVPGFSKRLRSLHESRPY